ncbi:MAG TPA: 2OG-Fe(II) oxygenase [Acidisoma sp.]|uniref:2OG-Fe(II) oxygenase family protein n=1 Tax=Acidisoma sp. TaxID=1872115 RepID=UPI002CEFA4DE|nr:2OG-Fe(II) oxygenase [Acidisoma sp.]HTI00067.1 2OG-Fe(II) oxygenase [Acidisoma sp.]
MIDLDYQALDETPVSSDPYTHVIVENFVRPEPLASVVAELPKLSKGGSFPIDSLKFGPHAKALMTELEGPRFRDAVARKFGLDLIGAPTMVTLRGASREKDGRIHCDSTTKRVTILLYLNPETEAWARREGCLRLLRGPDDIEDYVVEVPPVNGTLLIFPNGPTTWHGHKQFVGARYVIQLNYMTTDATARSEMRRHKVSAFIKRLTSSAA